MLLNLEDFKLYLPAEAAAAPRSMAQEQIFEYHLYTLGRATTIADKQTKRVASGRVPCR